MCRYPQQTGTAGGVIGLAKLRRDGFVSLDANETQAIIETKPIYFTNDVLYINVDCPNGSLTVEVLNENGDVIDQMSQKECLPLTGDSVNEALQWKTNSKRSNYSDQKLCLRFILKNGSLYSFWYASK